MNGLENPTIFGIHKAFEKTTFGKSLSENVRYAKYKPEHISNEQWTDLLGADVNNLTHMPLTYGIARAFVKHARVQQPDLLDPQEEEVLLTTALIHDWGEALTGDVSYGDKTDADEISEMAAFEEHLHEFYNGPDTALIEAAREVVFDHHDQPTKLGEVFNMIEHVGYMRTALRAFDVLRSDRIDEETRRGLLWLVTDVLSNTQDADFEKTPRLIQMKKFAPTATYIDAVSAKIADAMQMVAEHADSVFPNYGAREDYKRAQFDAAVKNWQTRQFDLLVAA